MGQHSIDGQAQAVDHTGAVLLGLTICLIGNEAAGVIRAALKHSQEGSGPCDYFAVDEFESRYQQAVRAIGCCWQIPIDTGWCAVK